MLLWFVKVSTICGVEDLIQLQVSKKLTCHLQVRNVKWHYHLTHDPMLIRSFLKQPQPHVSWLCANKVIKSKASTMDWIAKSRVKCCLIFNNHKRFNNFYPNPSTGKLLSKYLAHLQVRNINLWKISEDRSDTYVSYIFCNRYNIGIQAM